MLSFLPSNRIQESFFHLLENLKVYNLLNGIYESLASQSNAGQTLHSYGNRDVTLQSKHHCFTKPLLFLLLCLLWFTPSGMANNIQIANGKVEQVGADRFIEFDLSWENSWRVADLGHGVGNWDAAWVFVKYRVTAANGGDNLWKHVWLNTTNSDHVPGSGTGATINIGTTNISGTNRGMGAFIYRSGNGSGTFSTTGIQLRWEIAAQGLAATTPIEIRIFAIEMVYVAEGAFSVGSGGTELAHFIDGTTNNPFRITSEAVLSMGNVNGQLWSSPSTAGSETFIETAILPAAFPKGFAAFYMMKYEFSQQQYVDFLNTLTYIQQNPRLFIPPNAAVGTFAHNSDRHGIRIAVSGVSSTTPAVYETTFPFVANNFISWMDGAAYLDWSGLRPMTELEYEKAARGPAIPVPNEYAWGTASIHNSTSFSLSLKYTLNNQGAADEGILTNYNTTGTHGNANYYRSYPDLVADQGPMRVGIFAANGMNTGRVTSGASYWGIMGLTGNLFEPSVTVANIAGRSFTGLHGNGELNNDGAADVDHWPGINGNNSLSTANVVYGGTTGVTKAAGSGFRGGRWAINETTQGVSYRLYAVGGEDARSSGFGFRGVRSAP